MIRSSFIFCSLKNWFKDVKNIATQNNYSVSIGSTMIIGTGTSVDLFLPSPLFGTTYFVLLLVGLTVFGNTIFGIWKNNLKAKKFFFVMSRFDIESKEYRLNHRKWRNHKFEFKKTYFVFFKMLSFLSYLLVVKALTNDHVEGGGDWQIKALYLTTEVLIRVPIALFWYNEFKSIGENSEYIFEKKAHIFTIVGWIFEPRIAKFVGSKDQPLNPPDNEHEE